MTTRCECRDLRGFLDARGSALIGVLLLLMMMSALVAALGVNGRTETLISRNQYSGAQAQAAAEAGLNHAVELATTYIFEWKANGFGTVEEALDALLLGPDLASGTADTDLDNTSLGARVGIDEAEAIPLFSAPPRMTIADGIVAEYEAFIMDDDDTAPDEDGDPLNDVNDTLIIRAAGYGPDNTRVVLEAMISPIRLPAVVTNGDLDISDSVSIEGAVGSAHANGDLTMGGSASVSGTATASGERDVPAGPAGAGVAARLPLPEIRASDYLVHADFILTDAGTMTNQAGTVLCHWAPGAPCHNWNFDAGAWSLGSGAPAIGTYYVEGAVGITGSPGTAGSPVEITIIAEGSIDISGSPDLKPYTEGLMFVTDGDLTISGSLAMASHRPGRMLVHEQLRLSGNPDLVGQLLVENAPSEDSLVEANEISGNVTITYDGLDSDVYSLTGWRDIRQ